MVLGLPLVAAAAGHWVSLSGRREAQASWNEEAYLEVPIVMGDSPNGAL